MGKYTNIRQQIINFAMHRGVKLDFVLHQSMPQRNALIRINFPDLSLEEGLEQFVADLNEAAVAARHAHLSKTIIFSSEQVKIFLDLIAKKKMVLLDFALPFEDTLLQFSEPITLTTAEGSVEIVAMLLIKMAATQEEVEKSREAYDRDNAKIGISDAHRHSLLNWETDNTITINSVIAVRKDLEFFRVVWASQNSQIQTVEPDGAIINGSDMQYVVRSVAVACIGYINCENVYLEKEGEVPEKVNRKREREGKKILEPYYVCHIRGVKYNSAGEEVEKDASGRHVSFRFDVRGHFRRYESGKTTWVRPHQRGLQNELYVPKTYVVESREE